MNSEWERPWFSESSAPRPWPPLIPLDEPALPSFPVDALGHAVAPMVSAVARATQTPPDLAAVVALGTISAAVRGRFVVEPRSGWTETLVLFLLSLLESGNRKSAVFAAFTRPLTDHERERATGDRQELARWESRRRQQEADLKKLEGADEMKVPDARHKADALAMELAADRRPAITRLVVDDITAEKLSRELLDQGGALAVMSPEGGIFANLGGRYSGGVPSLDVLLKGHAGDTIRVDRIGREGEFIARPSLTVCICCQPSVVDDLRDFPGFRGRGAAARFLASFPVSPLGNRHVDSEPVPDGLTTQWAGLIASILDLDASTGTDADGDRLPRVLTLSRDADAVLTKFRRTVEVQLRLDGAFAEMKDWAGKFPGAVVRIAGLLHVAEHAGAGPDRYPVDEETVRRAISIGEYFAGHAEQFFARLAGKDTLADARDILAAIRRLAGNGPEVSRNALRQALRGQRRFATTADLSGPLGVLEEFGHVRVEERPGGVTDPSTGKSAAGRPSVWIVLRPAQPHARNTNNLPETTGTGNIGISGMGFGHPEAPDDDGDWEAF